MLTQTNELLQRLRAGQFDQADVENLEKAMPQELLEDLGSVYPFTFQQRKIGDKWEIGIAKLLRRELAGVSSPNSLFPIFVPVLIFKNCLFLSGEKNSVTGIAFTTGLKVKPVRKISRALALASGQGYKLDHAPDGWSLKKLEKRIVKLTEEFLQKRGFRFDAFWFFPSKATAS